MPKNSERSNPSTILLSTNHIFFFLSPKSSRASTPSMAAFDALFSLAQTTDPTRIQDIHLFSFAAKERIKTIHNHAVLLLSFLELSPEEAKSWEDKFRDVAYNIEYIIEKFMCQSKSCDYGRIKLLRVRFNNQLNHVMKDIGEIAEQIFDPAVSLSPSTSTSTSTLPPIGSSDTVVGLDKDLEVIKNLLRGETDKQKVIIPIVGMGGIGKTTLASTVYHDPFTRDHFDIRVWLTVSQDYRFRNILSGLVDTLKLPQELKSGDEIDESQIKFQVCQHLWKRRYLIIMDDVWGTKVWDDVGEDMFPDDGNGSRIVFTTRQLDEGYLRSYSARHDMQFMNDSQSWDLLKLKVFPNRNCPPELEDAGKEIARSCAGLPLAVVLVAGLLDNKTSSSWEKVAKNVNPVVNGEVEEILTLSYTYLPHHLRPCFLLIGGLEDAYIKTSRLTKLWVAEGFVKHQSDCDKTLEEKAEDYLEELVKRNLVIVASRKGDGKIKRCNLHDLVRDLCVRKARQEKFLSVLDGRDLPQGLMNERRVIVRCSDIDNLVCPTIHTILCFQIQNFPAWLNSLNYYEVLRVLNAIGIDLEELPSQVFMLCHLRYLALKGSFNIPPGISKLENLQTLFIHLASGKLRSIHGEIESYTLPEEIWRMRQLRHLVFDAPYVLPHPPDGLISCPLENLQTLLLVENLAWDECILQMIPNVKRLGLVYTTDKECHIHHLKDLGQLEKLELIGSPSFSWLGEYDNTIFPTTLRKLSLVGGVFLWNDMGRIIGSLPNLEVLKLLDYVCDGDTWETTDGDFPRLEFLLIDKSKIYEWITESSHFPRLKYLVLRSCWNLTEIPQEIGEIPTLELIEVDTACITVLESASQIKKFQEDYGNDAFQVRVAHEPLRIVESQRVKQQVIVQSLNQMVGLKDQLMKDQLKNISEKIGVFAGEMIDGVRPANVPIDVSSSSRLASIGRDAVVDIHNNYMREIMYRLRNHSSNLQVIPIVGKGGIGKTTLARTAYDDPSIMRHFQVRVWVTISQDYAPQEIIEHLLHSVKLLEEPISRLEYCQSEVVEEACKNLMAQILGNKIDYSEIAEQLHQMLEGKRYLIVMDNLRSTKVWDDVKNIFPDDDNGSRIMLTTRLSDVATYPDFGSPLHQMMPMNDYQSWNLLKEKVLIRHEYWPTGLEDVGKKIARKCVGLPLAVVLVAGVLVSKSSRGSWKDIDINVKSVFESELEDILSLSYTHLLGQSRKCFLFMGGFPENRSIRASRLIKLWIAEGCLGREGGEMEYLAEMYLEELVERNLVIATSRTSSGKIKSCRLHDMVRDMCRRKADEEKFLKDQATCSILCFHLQKIPPIWVAFSGGFRLLRAWEAIQNELPPQVFELEDLRYIALNASLDIPSAISKLSYLQTLIIHPTLSLRKRYGMYDETSSHFSLPVEIWSLRHLRHLIFYDLFMLPHPPSPATSNSPLRSLQTLWRVKNLEWTMEILQMIPNVKKLGLAYIEVNNTFEDYGLDQLENLRQLKKLELYGSDGFSWRSQNPSFPRTLKKLTLVGGVLPWEDMGIIGSLPNLQVLKLLDHVCDDETWETAGDEFRNLEFLQIERSRLSQWITESSHFPRLKNLVIGSCRFLMKIPQCMGDIPTLEFIHLDYNCSESLVRSANQIQRDKQSKGNYAFQVRRHSTEHYGKIREAQVTEVAENRASIFRRILNKTRVICNRVAKRLQEPRW